MLILRPCNAEIGVLRLRGLKLRLGGCHGFVRFKTALAQAANELEILLPCQDSRVQYALLLLHATKLKVVCGQIRMSQQADVLQIGGRIKILSLTIPPKYQSARCSVAEENLR